MTKDLHHTVTTGGVDKRFTSFAGSNGEYSYNASAVPAFVLTGTSLLLGSTVSNIWVSPPPHDNNYPKTNFQYVFVNAGPAITATLAININDRLYRVTVNYRTIWGPWESDGYIQVNNIIIPTGTNLFQFYVSNASGRDASLAVVVVDSTTSTPLFQTDSSWYFIPRYPVTSRVATVTLATTGLVKNTESDFPAGALVLNGAPDNYVNLGSSPPWNQGKSIRSSVITGMYGLTFSIWFKTT